MLEKERREIVDPSAIRDIFDEVFAISDDYRDVEDVPVIELFSPEAGVQTWPIEDFARDVRANGGKEANLPSSIIKMPDYYRFIYDEPDKVIADIKVTDKTAIGMILAELVAFAEDARADIRIKPKTSWFGTGKPFFLMDITGVYDDGEEYIGPATETPDEWENDEDWPCCIKVKSYDMPLMGTQGKNPVYVTLYYDKEEDC